MEDLVTKKTNNTRINIRTLDNGYLISVERQIKEGYESVEIAVPTLPKLLTAIGTFLKDKKENK